MAIASPSAPGFCCTARSGATQRRFLHPISRRAAATFRSRVSARPAIVSRLNPSFSDGEVVYELNYNSHRRRRDAFPVYVTLPQDAVGPTAQTMRRKKVMSQSFRALAAAGVEGVVMEVWWGMVENQFPRNYCWRGYLEIVELARRYGLRVRAVMAFHQCGSGPEDPLWIPLPSWVLEAMKRDPDVSFSDRFGRRSMEYISLGCDILPVLHGRSPIQAYGDLMRSFRDVFRSFLGGVITGVQVGLGPGGELRYPSCPTQKLNWGWRARELGEFQCYDKYMLASLNACAYNIGKREWGDGGPLGTGSLMQNPESTDFFKANGSWKTPYGEFFLEWYSSMLLFHGERICREAETIFRGREISMSGKVAGVHWHYGTQSHPSELTCGYYNTQVRDGLVPIACMFGRYGFSLCCACFEMQDAVEEEVNPLSRPEGFLKQLLMSARICDIPFEGQNCSTKLKDESFKQMLRMAQLYSDGLETPSFSFNFVRLDKNLFEPGNWAGFARFVRQISSMNMFRGNLDIAGGNAATSSSAAFTGAVLAC